MRHTLIAFYFTVYDLTHDLIPLKPLIDRIELAAVKVCQGVYLLRTSEDAQLVVEFRRAMLSLDIHGVIAEIDGRSETPPPFPQAFLRLPPDSDKKLQEWLSDE